MFVKNFTENQFVNGRFFYIQQNYDEIKFLIFRQQKHQYFYQQKATCLFNEYYLKKNWMRRMKDFYFHFRIKFHAVLTFGLCSNKNMSGIFRTR